MLLTDEGINRTRYKYKYNELYKGGALEYTMRPNHCELVAKAQLKKVVKFIAKRRDACQLNDEEVECRLCLSELLKALLEEVK